MHCSVARRIVRESGEAMSDQAAPGGNDLGEDSETAEVIDPDARSASREPVADDSRPRGRAGEMPERAGEVPEPTGEMPEQASEVPEPARVATEQSVDPVEQAGAVASPARPDTGEPRVDAALTQLDRLAELPVTEHAAVFERVHAELTAVLGQLDPESADGG
jgi:hypothetical protein